MVKFLVSTALLLIATVIFGQFLLFLRFKKERNKGEFLGDFHQYRVEKLMKTWPDEKPRLNSHYERPWSEIFIYLSFFGIGLFLIFRFIL